MKRIALAILAFLSLCGPALAVCPPTLQLKDNAGTIVNQKYSDDGSGNCLPNAFVNGSGPIPSGTNTIGGVTFVASPTFGATPGHILSAASNNATSVKASAGTLYSITVIQTTTTLGDLRFYDTAGLPICSSATGVVANFAVQSNAISAGFSLNFGAAGLQFNNGIGFCLTGAIADNDNTNFTTGVQVNYTYK